MTDFSKLSFALVLLTFAFLAVNPHSVFLGAGFITACILFGFSFWIDRRKLNDKESLEAQIKDLKERLNHFMIGKGMGR
jgi:uncharacterized membrane protein YciS (DUF1049 family)